MSIPIQLLSLSYQYPQKKVSGIDYVLALNQINYEFEKGKTYALLGHNGAGKTTLLRLLASSLTLPTCKSLNKPDWAQNQFVGALLEQPGFYKHQSALEYLEFFASLYPHSMSQAEIIELCDYFQFKDLDKKCIKLSLGNKQKIQIIRSFLNFPQLILLDEPISNLDPQAQSVFWNYLSLYTEKYQPCIILSSHLLLNLPEIIDEVLVLKEGQLIRSVSSLELKGSLIPQEFIQRFEELKSEFKMESIQLEFDFNRWFLELSK